MDVFAFFTDYTLRTVALGAALLGSVSGSLGTFALLRRRALLGDAMSHAALPGIALAFLITGSKAPLVILAGAAVAGWLGAWFVLQVVRLTRIKEDSALGLVLSVFFGVGLVLLTWIQKQPDASQAGLDKFLFGQAATLMEKDLLAMTALGIPAVLLMLIFWKELKLLSFDREFGDSLGFPMRRLDLLLTSLLVIAIVIGLQTVGVVLMSAMIVAPAAAARQWTDRLGVMVLLAALFGAAGGVSGAVLSSSVRRLPTGPTIVLLMSAVVVISLVLAPNRGLLWAWLRQLNNRRRLQLQAVLEDLYALSLQHDEPGHPHATAVLRSMSSGHGGADRSLVELESQGLARRVGPDRWTLTEQGAVEALKAVGEQGGTR
jgi:manganese/zinc/iron transport system permease protein